MVDFNLPFTPKRRFNVVSDDEVMLTDRGKEAVENDAYSGGRALVLMTLKDRGSMSIKELSTETRMPVDRVKDIVVILMGKAQVMKMSYGGG